MAGEMNARDAFLTTVGTLLECLCAELSYANDLRTLEVLQWSDTVADQAAVAAAKDILRLRVQQRAADMVPNGGGTH